MTNLYSDPRTTCVTAENQDRTRGQDGDSRRQEEDGIGQEPHHSEGSRREDEAFNVDQEMDNVDEDLDEIGDDYDDIHELVDNEDDMQSQSETLVTEPFDVPIEIFLPTNYFEEFRRVSKENSELGKDGKETFAYMFGQDRESERFITHLLLVEQNGTHSFCEPTTKGNIQFADFQNKNPLLKVVGWSHTHPM